MAFISECPCEGSLVPVLSCRASSASLLISNVPYEYIDGTAEQQDISIAAELLATEYPRIPPRRSSFSQSPSLRRPMLDGEEHRISARKDKERRSRLNTSSNTWTSSSGDGSDGDDVEDRSFFVQEYNRLAKKYGVHSIVPDEFERVYVDKVTIVAKQGSWIMRKLLRRTSSVQPSNTKSDKKVKHRRSVSDLTGRMRTKKDRFKDKHLGELVRLCGASPLYLPSEYAAGTLSVPTCFRATAQYLVQHATATRGIFRIPGSHTSVNSLYNHYASQDEGGEIVSGTVRCPTLPNHIDCDAHDVASAFKKFLSGLPGGILGKSWLFDALISIQNYLDSDPEWTRTKQSKVRARLIALAIACHTSRLQRELICAVFGLLSMIGRAAETAQREDSHGRPLPTSDLMGYGSLGIVFGPLLIGELMNEYKMPAKELIHGSVITQPSPPKSSKGKQKKSKTSDETLLASKLAVEKATVANEVAEMLIMHWREVVRHMRNLGVLKSTKDYQNQSLLSTRSFLRPSASETFVLHKPPEWDMERSSGRRVDRSKSPTPNQKSAHGGLKPKRPNSDTESEVGGLSVIKSRARIRPLSGHRLLGAKSMGFLSPTVEDPGGEQRYSKLASHLIGAEVSQRSGQYHPSIKLATSNSEADKLSSESIKHGARRGMTESRLTPSVSQRQELLHCSSIPDSLNAAATSRRTPGNVISSQGGWTARGMTLTENFQDSQHWREIDSEVVKPNITAANAKLDVSRSNYASPERATAQKLSSSPPKGFESRQSRRKQSQVPEGIVSQRLKDFGGSTPEKRLQSQSQLSQETSNKPDRKPKEPLSNYNSGYESPIPMKRSRDQLSRISYKDERASVPTLGTPIESQVEPSHSTMSKTTSDLNITELEDSKMSHALHTEAKEVSEDISSSNEVEGKELDSDKKTDRSIVKGPKDAQRAAFPNTFVTPSRRTVDHAVGNRSGTGSVKAMAARFNDADQGSGPQPSPTHPLEIRRVNRNGNIESPVVSSYTTNPSPTPRSRKSNRSDKSLKAVSNSRAVDHLLEAKPATPPPKSSGSTYSKVLSISQSANSSSSFHLPKLRHVDTKSLDETSRNSPKASATLFPMPSTLMRTGDGNASFSLIRQPTLGTLLPHPDEPPVAQHLTFSRPSSILGYSDSAHLSSPQNGRKTSIEIESSVISGVSVTTANDHRQIVRGNSVLYSQIQNLQRQLQSKAEEIDHLRRQILTKGSLNDLGTLSEELRQVKRDLKFWQNRAESAEKRLELIRQLEPQVNLEMDDGEHRESSERIFASKRGSGVSGSEDNTHVAERIRKALHGLDGVASADCSLESEETVRRDSVGMTCYPSGI